jgi:hypothetical protein
LAEIPRPNRCHRLGRLEGAIPKFTTLPKNRNLASG